MGSAPNWFELGNKACDMQKVSKLYVVTGYLR